MRRTIGSLATVRYPIPAQDANRQNYNAMTVLQALVMTLRCRSF